MGTKLNSVSKSTGTGKSKKDIRVEVRQIENGFIVRKSTEWHDDKKGYQYESKEWYSPKDPLEISEDNKSLADIFD